MKNLILLTSVILLATGCAGESASFEFNTILIENYLPHLKSTEENQGLSYVIDFTYPCKYGDKAILKTLQSKFITHVLGEKYASLTPQEATDACINDWKEEYLNETKEYPFDEDGFIPTFVYFVAGTVPLVTDKLLQLQVEGNLSQSTTHIVSSWRAALFDLRTGNELGKNDIFDPQQGAAIKQLLIREIAAIAEYEFERNEVWTEETGFALLENAIAFLFGDYQLGGAYGLNIRRVEVSYDKIFPCLIQGTPAWEYANLYRLVK